MNPATREAKTPWSSGDEDPLWLLTPVELKEMPEGTVLHGIMGDTTCETRWAGNSQTPWRTRTCSRSTTASTSVVPCERSSTTCQSVRDSPSGCDTVTRTFPGEP